ncbi:GNAT family N-acetyltransferase [Pseudorhodoferax sp.]|uniref:GNAT family N-acetyltransferase n=1 Tax=Pseudorhodoferax sp. TaxID=1993553 RepID=UPI0039E6DDAB
MDMLIALSALPARPAAPAGFRLRKPIGPEHDLVAAWVARCFSPAWASEARAALANRPASLFVATCGEPAELRGFCGYDATARGFVGPIGVQGDARGQGLGAALLLACLHDMRATGYGYAVAGAVGAPGFFRRVAGAIDIPGSTPGLYAGLLRAPPAAP